VGFWEASQLNQLDIVIVGGGIAGCIAAQTAAERGYRVAIIDLKTKTKIGDKICGEAVGKHHFDNTGIPPPKGEDVFSPDRKTVCSITEKDVAGYVINRLAFGQRLLAGAVDKGVELFDQTLALEPVFQQGFTVGIKVKHLLSQQSREIRGTVIIDASGAGGILRGQMARDWHIENNIENEDMEACYREIRKISSPIDEPEHLQIFFNQQIAPGGYFWVFPKGTNLVNVGLGVQMTKGFPNPTTQLHQHVFSQPFFKDSQKISGGTALIPTRRSINLVGNGVLFVGDSACQTNPAHGGGMGPAMISGKLAAEAACKAIEMGDVSQQNLWPYNIDYMKRLGVRYAGLDVFRIFLQKCPDADMNYGMAHRMIKADYIFSRATLDDDVELNKELWCRDHTKRSVLRMLVQTSRNMKKIRERYTEFPQCEGYAEWARTVDEIIIEMKAMTP